MATENGDDNKKVLYKYDENVLKVQNTFKICQFY